MCQSADESQQLTSIGLRNFRCFVDQEIGLGKLTLLTGMNGAGKSTVIQSLLLLRQSRIGLLLHRTPIGLRQGKLITNGGLVQLGPGRELLNRECRGDDPCSITLSWKDGARTEWRLFHSPDWGMSGVWDADEAPWLNVSVHSPYTEYPDGRAPIGGMCHYLPAHRGSAWKRDVLFYLAGRGKYPIELTNLSLKDTNSDLLACQAASWLEVLCPGVRITPEMLNGTDKGIHERFDPTKVGEGLAHALPVVTTILSASKGELLILENPESHLHPRGQIRLADLLAQAAAEGVQIIVETHSDHILNGVRIAIKESVVSPDEVRIHHFCQDTRSAAPTVISPVIDRDGRMNRWPEGFFNEWENSLDRLL